MEFTHLKEYERRPHMIEDKSMEIIESEMEAHSFSDEELAIVKRVIHTTADFEYQNLVKFNGDVIDRVKEAIFSGSHIVADTNMIRMGINKTVLNKYDVEVKCFVADEEVAKEAKERGVTRSIVGIEKACKDDKNKIFVIGNAPTALVKLIELIENGDVTPAAVIGVPVGFVGAKESKELLKEKNIPYITVEGRKGGSTVAASMINAISKMI